MSVVALALVFFAGVLVGFMAWGSWVDFGTRHCLHQPGHWDKRAGIVWCRRCGSLFDGHYWRQWGERK